MFPKCVCQKQWEKIDPDPAMFLKCSHLFRGTLTPSVMRWMRSEDVNDIFAECHYDDQLWGFAIRTAETWRTSN